MHKNQTLEFRVDKENDIWKRDCPSRSKLNSTRHREAQSSVPSPLCRNQEHRDGHKSWGPCTDASARTHIHPVPRVPAPAPHPKSACPCRRNPVRSSSRDQTGQVGRLLPATCQPRRDAPLPVRPPQPPWALQSPARFTYRRRAAGLKSQPRERSLEAERRLVGPPLPAHPAELLTSHRRWSG